MENIKIYQTERILFDRKITAVVVRTQKGLQITISGGDLSHIGAVSVTKNGDKVDTTVFPGHKDQFISERWAGAVSRQLQGSRKTLSGPDFAIASDISAGTDLVPVVVSAGVHYDDLSREGIEAVLQVSEEMLAEVLEWIGAEGD